MKIRIHHSNFRFTMESMYIITVEKNSNLEKEQAKIWSYISACSFAYFGLYSHKDRILNIISLSTKSKALLKSIKREQHRDYLGVIRFPGSEYALILTHLSHILARLKARQNIAKDSSI